MNRGKRQNKTEIVVREENEWVIKGQKFEGQKKKKGGSKKEKNLGNFIQLQKPGDGRTRIEEKETNGKRNRKGVKEMKRVERQKTETYAESLMWLISVQKVRRESLR
jgi:hypothetical protein